MSSISLTVPDILTLKYIAVIGFSTNPEKPGQTVPLYLRDQGYTIYPVNPRAGAEIAGLKVYPDLSAVPEPVDIVCVFRPPAELPGILEDIRRRSDVQVLWMQPGAEHPETAAAAEASGITAVLGKCMYQEHRASDF